MKLFSRVGLARGALTIGSAMGLQCDLGPSDVISVCRYRREEITHNMALEAMTQFNLLVARERGAEWPEPIAHLMSPEEREADRKRKELAISQNRLAYFEKLARAWNDRQDS